MVMATSGPMPMLSQGLIIGILCASPDPTQFLMDSLVFSYQRLLPLPEGLLPSSLGAFCGVKSWKAWL